MITNGKAAKTRVDLDYNVTGFWYVYDKPNGKVIGKIAENTAAGVVIRTDAGTLVNGEANNWVYLKLFVPIGSYAYAYMKESTLFEVKPKYTIKIATGRTNVNVRDLPNQTTSKVLKKLNGGQIVGMSNGDELNGFMLLDLQGGGIGFVSKNYLTTVSTERETPEQPKPENPVDGTTTQKGETAIENIFGSNNKQAVKYGLIGAGVLFLGLIIGSLFKKKK